MLTYRDVMPIFVSGKFVGCDIVYRACDYFKKLSHADARLHVADPHIVASMILGDAVNVDCDTLRVNPTKVRGYVRNHPDMCWASHIAKGRAVYVPVNYPYHTRVK